MSKIINSSKRALTFSCVGVCILLQACTTTSSGNSVSSTAVDKAIGKCVGSVALSTIGGALIGSAINGSSGAQRGAVAGAVAGLGACVVLIELAKEEDKIQLRKAQLAALEVDQTTTSSFVTQSGKTAKVTTKITPAPPLVKKKAAAKKVQKKEPVKQAEVIKVEPDALSPASEASTINVQSAIPQNQTQPELAEVQPVISETTQKPEEVAELAFVEEKPTTVECRFASLKIDMDGGLAETENQKWCKSNDGSWEPVSS